MCALTLLVVIVSSRCSYQFFGSESGFIRVYPGRPWQRNVIGMREDYDARLRPWYVGATSGPKDVVIILDMSRSMGDFRGRRYVKDSGSTPAICITSKLFFATPLIYKPCCTVVSLATDFRYTLHQE